MPEYTDHNIIFQQKPVDLLGGIERGQKIGFDYQNNPTQLEQARVNLAFDQAANPIKLQQGQATLQSTLTQNESDKIKLEQERQQNEFLRYLDTNRPGLQPDGTIDKNQALVDMAKAGHSRNALGYIDQVYKTQAAGIKNDQDLYTLQMGALKDASNVVSSMPTSTPQERAAKAEAVQRLEVYTKKQTGKSATEILGPNWHSSARNINIGPVEATNLEVTQRNNNIDADAKDPNSPLNRAQNEFNDRYAPGVATSRRLSDSSRMPEQQAAIQSQMISGQTRAESAGAASQAATTVGSIDDLLTRSQELPSKIPLKYAENLSNIYKAITNDSDRAILDAWVADTERVLGRPIDRSVPIEGTIQSLKRLRDQARISGGQAASQVRSTSFSQTPAGGGGGGSRSPSQTPTAPAPAQTPTQAPSFTNSLQATPLNRASPTEVANGRLIGTYKTVNKDGKDEELVFTPEDARDPKKVEKLRRLIASGRIKASGK